LLLIKTAIGTSKTLSVDICASWLESSWNNYVHSIAEKANEIVLMAYDSSKEYESYTEWVSDVTILSLNNVKVLVLRQLLEFLFL